MQPAEPASTWRFTSTLDDLEAEFERAPNPDLITGLWPSSLTVLAGKPYAGKTWLAMHMTRAVLSQESFLGMETDQRRHVVVYVGTDASAARDALRRARALRIRGDGFLMHRHRLPRPTEPGAWAAAVSEWKARGVTVVVLDNLMGLIPGADVNDSSQVGPLMARCRDLVEDEGLAVLLVHHASKTGGASGPMGSQAIDAAARCTLALGEPANDGSRLTVTANEAPGRTLRLRLQEERLELLSAVDSVPTPAATRRAPRNRGLDEQRALARKVLDEAPQDALASQSALGRWLEEKEWVGDGKEAGRNKVKQVIRNGFLDTDESGRVVAGPNLGTG